MVVQVNSLFSLFIYGYFLFQNEKKINILRTNKKQKTKKPHKQVVIMLRQLPKNKLILKKIEKFNSLLKKKKDCGSYIDKNFKIFSSVEFLIDY